MSGYLDDDPEPTDRTSDAHARWLERNRATREAATAALAEARAILDRRKTTNVRRPTR